MENQIETITRNADAAGWGGLSIGDLGDTVRRAADLLGSSLAVTWLSVDPPNHKRDLPRVRVMVDDPATAEKLRARLMADDPLPHFVGDPYSAAWQIELDDLVLCIVCDPFKGER